MQRRCSTLPSPSSWARFSTAITSMLSPARWCPNCLAEHSYHRVWWDLVPITTCPFHGVDLVSRCACDMPLRTEMNFHDYCRKGHALSEVPTTPAPESCLVVDRYVVNRLLGAKEQGPSHLDATALEDVIDLADHLGRELMAPDLKLGNSRRDSRRRHLLAAGFSAISDLDGKFVEALDELASREHAAKKRWGLEKTYGKFYLWLATHHESAARSAILDAMSRHAASRTALRSGMLMGRDVQNDASLTIVQAAQACRNVIRALQETGDRTRPCAQGSRARHSFSSPAFARGGTCREVA